MRGDVVIVDLKPNNPASKVRPALVIQNDVDNRRMANTIIAEITSNISRAHEQTQLLIDTSHPDWARAGLRLPSVVNCSNLATIQSRHVKVTIGSLSAETMQQLDQCLRAALDL